MTSRIGSHGAPDPRNEPIGEDLGKDLLRAKPRRKEESIGPLGFFRLLLSHASKIKIGQPTVGPLPFGETKIRFKTGSIRRTSTDEKNPF